MEADPPTPRACALGCAAARDHIATSAAIEDGETSLCQALFMGPPAGNPRIATCGQRVPFAGRRVKELLCRAVAGAVSGGL